MAQIQASPLHCTSPIFVDPRTPFTANNSHSFTQLVDVSGNLCLSVRTSTRAKVHMFTVYHPQYLLLQHHRHHHRHQHRVHMGGYRERFTNPSASYLQPLHPSDPNERADLAARFWEADLGAAISVFESLYFVVHRFLGFRMLWGVPRLSRGKPARLYESMGRGTEVGVRKPGWNGSVGGRPGWKDGWT